MSAEPGTMSAETVNLDHCKVCPKMKVHTQKGTQNAMEIHRMERQLGRKQTSFQGKRNIGTRH